MDTQNCRRNRNDSPGWELRRIPGLPPGHRDSGRVPFDPLIYFILLALIWAASGSRGATVPKVRAERLVLASLKQLKWRPTDLATWPKGDESKVKLALEVRRETTMTRAGIAKRLRRGSAGYLEFLFHQSRNQPTRYANNLN